MHRKLTRGVKLAVKQRLETLLADELAAFDRWRGIVAPKLNATRRASVERNTRKRIQALRIVIWMLTPAEQREDDIPNLFEATRGGADPS